MCEMQRNYGRGIHGLLRNLKTNYENLKHQMP